MKKVLIITYYWPPAGGPGVQRWLKFVKYLRDYDVEPVVYVPEQAHYPLKDDNLSSEVPPDLTLLKKKIWEPYSVARIFSGSDTARISRGILPEEGKQGLAQKLMLFIRGNFFIPDARRFWIRPSVRYLTKYLREHRIDALITTGPPHSMHLIGWQLKKKTGTRWIADFRDPWTQIGYHNKLKLLPAARRRHEYLERLVLQNADQLITTSFLTRKEFQEKTSVPIEVITNGYDQSDVAPPPPDQKFTLAHIGSLLSGRNPRLLWQALRELCQEHADFAADFKLHLVGATAPSVLEEIHRAGLDDFLVIKKYVSHKEALQLQKSSQLLLLIEIDSEETRGIIPGKLFEYMVSNRPILAVGPAQSDVEKLLNSTNTGSYFLYAQKEEMKHFLLEKYKLYKKKELVSHPVGLQQYSRKELTRRLSDLIKKNG